MAATVDASGVAPGAGDGQRAPTNGEADCYLLPGERGEVAVAVRMTAPDGEVTEFTLCSDWQLAELVQEVRGRLAAAVDDYLRRPAPPPKAAVARTRMGLLASRGRGGTERGTGIQG